MHVGFVTLSINLRLLKPVETEIENALSSYAEIFFSEEYLGHFKTHVFIQILPILATIACPDLRRPDRIRNHGFFISEIDPF